MTDYFKTGDMVEVQCPPCFQCGVSSAVLVSATQWRRYRNGGLIQQAFPDMTPDQREMLVTGTHPACWEQMFGGDDE